MSATHPLQTVSDTVRAALLQVDATIQFIRREGLKGTLSAAQAAVFIEVAQSVQRINADTLKRLRQIQKMEPSEGLAACKAELSNRFVKVEAVKQSEEGCLQRRFCLFCQEKERQEKFPDGVLESEKEVLMREAVELEAAFAAFQSPERQFIQKIRAAYPSTAGRPEDPATADFLRQVFAYIGPDAERVFT